MTVSSLPWAAAPAVWAGAKHPWLTLLAAGAEGAIRLKGRD